MHIRINIALRLRKGRPIRKARLLNVLGFGARPELIRITEF